MLERISFWDAVGVALAMSAALSIVISFHGRFRPQFRFSSIHRTWIVGPLPLIAALSTWLLFTFLSIALLALAGRDFAFETMFRVLAAAMLPAMAGWMLAPVRFLGRRPYRAWQAITVVGSAASFVCLWWFLQISHHLPEWQTALAALPCAAFLAVVETLILKVHSQQFLTICDWRRTGGKHVVLFGSRSRPETQVVDLAHRCDCVVEQVAMKLDVSLPTRPIGVFIFDTRKNLRAAHRGASKKTIGFAYQDCVAIADGEWEKMRSVLSHELTHVLGRPPGNVAQIGLLEEGLAEYIESEIAEDNAIPPKLTVPVPLRFLAHNSVFYDWKRARETECTPVDYYNHAHALVRYLIETYGLEKFKDFRLEACAKNGETRGEQFARAARKVFGVSLWELEYQWRITCGCAHPMWRTG